MELKVQSNFTKDCYFLTLDSEGYEFIKKKKISFKKLYGGVSHQSRYWTHHGGGGVVVEHYCATRDLGKAIEYAQSLGVFDIRIISNR